jgi:hypothetical protein
MGKVDDVLARIATIEDSTVRAFQLAGLSSALLKIKGVVPIMMGALAYDCYVSDTNTNRELWMGTYAGKLTPRILQEVFGEQMHGQGLMWEWQIAGISVHLTGDAPVTHRDLAREFQGDYGSIRLVPIEEITAERVLASIIPGGNEQAALEAKRLMQLGLSNALVFNWRVLQDLCNHINYRVGEQLARLRMEAKAEYDEEEKQKTGELPMPPEMAPLSQTGPVPEMPETPNSAEEQSPEAPDANS